MPVPAELFRNLREAGLEGNHMLATLRGEALELRGERAGELTLPVVEIERMRVGFVSGKGVVSYETVIWRSRARDPISVVPLRPLAEPEAYADLVRGLAARVARRRGRRAVETGYWPAYWGVVFGVLAAVWLLTIGLVLFVLPGEDVPAFSIVLLIAFPPLLVALVGWEYLKVHRPRAVRDLAELDRHLPGPNAQRR